MDISPKQRFLDIAHFKRPGDLFMICAFVQGNIPWAETPPKWIEQGAPKEITKLRFFSDYFQFQHIRWLSEIRSGVNAGMNWWEEETYRGQTVNIHGIEMSLDSGDPTAPNYKPTFVSEDERTVTMVRASGQTVRYLKSDPTGMPMFLDWPVKDRTTWNEHKKRLDPHTPERWPADWNAYVQEMNSKSEPLSLAVGSFFGFLRDWVGTKNIFYMFYDDPVLIEDMMEHMLYMETEIIKRTLKDIKVQQATFWEDMCYKSGPMISPAMVRKFMMPRYKKITDLLHSYGVDVIYLDCDGDVSELIPLWLESGVNLLWPFEVAAGNDAVALRKKYGKDLIISGTIDKRTLVKGKEAIKEEVMSKVPFLLEQGGYFPSADHLVPPDVTFENYCYFVNLMREVAGLEKLSF